MQLEPHRVVRVDGRAGEVRQLAGVEAFTGVGEARPVRRQPLVGGAGVEADLLGAGVDAGELGDQPGVVVGVVMGVRLPARLELPPGAQLDERLVELEEPVVGGAARRRSGRPRGPRPAARRGVRGPPASATNRRRDPRAAAPGRRPPPLRARATASMVGPTAAITASCGARPRMRTACSTRISGVEVAMSGPPLGVRRRQAAVLVARRRTRRPRSSTHWIVPERCHQVRRGDQRGDRPPDAERGLGGADVACPARPPTT